MDKVVIIPTFNEIENIEKIIRKVFSLSGGYHIKIIDDGSPDGTAQKVKELQREFPDRLFLTQREGKQGLGTAYICGFKWALERNYQYIFEMDADFSHNPDDLDRLYEVCATGQGDLAVGSRYVKGGSVVNWPFNRILISYGASLYTRMITWMPVKDCTAGFVCYTRRVLQALPLDEVRFVGYAFQIEMKYRTWRKGFKIKEIPIEFIDRQEGVSKMSKGIVKEAVLGVWKMRGFV
ncbi:MAG: dolichyl-phosphate beta-D-mannosyltransferase [Bacteroidetes bacterium 47-18]|nr:MAG: dolichyl-phosphate beta-D-mannosyltransferase [Bacteroidetes bacterium 47-18]